MFGLTNLRLLGFTFFCLETKRTKNSRMPYRLRAAFFPARLGGYFAHCLSQLIFMTALYFCQMLLLSPIF